jgi:hypothetical protein
MEGTEFRKLDYALEVSSLSEDELPPRNGT